MIKDWERTILPGEDSCAGWRAEFLPRPGEPLTSHAERASRAWLAEHERILAVAARHNTDVSRREARRTELFDAAEEIKAGGDPGRIAKEHGFDSWKSMLEVMRRFGIPNPRDGERERIAAKHEAMLRDKANGMTYTQLAQKYGYTSGNAASAALSRRIKRERSDPNASQGPEGAAAAGEQGC